MGNCYKSAYSHTTPIPASGLLKVTSGLSDLLEPNNNSRTSEWTFKKI